MPPKLQLDKGAWQWAENTLPSNVTQEHIRLSYRLNLKPCLRGSCKRNCRGNPFCLNAVGEKAWFAKLDEKHWHDFDPVSERRAKGSFVGLKNLGATCYVNTFLQLWYHNLTVRKALYRWQEPNLPDTLPDDWTPSSICGHLQLIFALLQFSARRYIDPSSFINHLGLDAGQQQDAQEFSKLFLSLLEDALAGGESSKAGNVVQEQFSGKYCYVTRCKNCGTESRTGSQFFELDLSIKGHKVLRESIEDFLKEEKLEGENQYMCVSCAGKQNATRAIRLQTLPPVLNIQLLRFVFDKNSGHKKKLNSFIQFPEVLDMSKYLQQQENTTVYDLTAVLIHRGPSAYSGHYVAHIKTSPQQPWYKFNDEDIEEMKGRNLHLGTEDEIQDSAKEKKGRVAKGCHSSKNAYMLVYTRQGSQNNVSREECDGLESLLPVAVQQYVMRDNDKFEQWIAELISARENKIQTGKDEQEDVQEKYVSLLYEPDCQYDWLSFEWITKWLSDPGKVSQIKHRQYLCQHQRLNPDMVPKLKCVNRKGADALVKKYGIDTRLQGDRVLCDKCVQNRCYVIHMKQRISEDEKLVNSALKFSYDSEMCYWVGRSSLRSWKRLATSTFHQDTPPDDNNGNGVGETDENREEGESAEKDDMDAQIELQFNTDLLCDHGNLSPDKGCRRLVPAETWKRLKSYFPSCPEFRRDDALCEKCQLRTAEEAEAKDVYRQSAASQKSALGDLFAGKNRPCLEVGSQVNIVSSKFINEWRRFIKDNGNRRPLSAIINKDLLCEHGGLLYPPTSNGNGGVPENLCLLWPSEWALLTQHLSHDITLSAVHLQETDGSTQLVTEPEVCKECVSERLASEESSRFIYRDCVLYVRKVGTDKKNGPVPTPSVTGTGPGAGNGTVVRNDDQSSDSFDRFEDPDYAQSQAKKKKLEDGPQGTEKMSVVEDSIRRKSQRHRKTRGEKEVIVSSNMTLKDLKIKIMKSFAVPPFDQNLSLDGVTLSDDTVTLQNLRISPGDIIMLQADEPPDEAYQIEDLERGSSKPEKGFQGTNLLSS